MQQQVFFGLFKDREPIAGVKWSKRSANLQQLDDGSWVHVVAGGARAKVCLSDHFVFRFVCEYTGVKPAAGGAAGAAGGGSGGGARG